MGPQLAGREDPLLNLKAKGLQSQRALSETNSSSVKVLISSRLPDNQEKPILSEVYACFPQPPSPLTNHRFLSKKGNCLKLKLLWSIIGFGGCGKKMEGGRGETC